MQSYDNNSQKTRKTWISSPTCCDSLLITRQKRRKGGNAVVLFPYYNASAGLMSCEYQHLGNLDMFGSIGSIDGFFIISLLLMVIRFTFYNRTRAIDLLSEGEANHLVRECHLR